MKTALPILLAFNGGYVDTAGFLALEGLFPAHVTGNCVTLGAALVFGTSGVLSKVLAIPVFWVVVLTVRLLGSAVGGSSLRVLLGAKLALLIVGGALAIRLGPFPDGDTWPALATGWALIAAMAVQNALQRIHMPSAPPTNIMTGNTTQLMIDIADLLRDTPQKERDAARTRAKRIAVNLAVFICGCAAGAALFDHAGMECFALPPVVALIAVLVRADFAPPPPAATGNTPAPAAGPAR
jgi:uncharacterized membrane protein YoaK (UPF0700 family)